MTTLTAVARIARADLREEAAEKLHSQTEVEPSLGSGVVAEDAEVTSAPLRHAYHEMGHSAGRAAISGRGLIEHVVEMDVLEQLKTNLDQLEELHGRMKFMMAEVSYLIVRS